MLIALFLSVGFAQEPAVAVERESTIAEREFILISNRFCFAKPVESKSLEARATKAPLCKLAVEAGLASLSFNVPTPCSATSGRCETTMTVEISLPAKNPIVIAASEMTCGSESIVCTLSAESVMIADVAFNRTVIESQRKGESRVIGHASWLQSPDGSLIPDMVTP